MGNRELLAELGDKRSYCRFMYAHALRCPKVDMNQKGKKFKEIERSTLFTEIDAVVLHDAVLGIAIIWKSIWSKFADEKTSNKQWKE